VAQILIRNLEQSLISRLKRRARCQKRSLESEVRTILEQAARMDMDDALKVAASIRRRFKGRRFGDSAGLIRRDRDR
jgi:plasmid stability protein